MGQLKKALKKLIQKEIVAQLDYERKEQEIDESILLAKEDEVDLLDKLADLKTLDEYISSPKQATQIILHLFAELVLNNRVLVEDSRYNPPYKNEQAAAWNRWKIEECDFSGNGIIKFEEKQLSDDITHRHRLWVRAR